jgi:hypothetical protein
MRNLSVPHAKLHPIDRTAKSVSSARGAGSQFVSRHMLAQAVLAALAEDIPYPNDRTAKPASPARGAGSQLVSQHMLAQAVLALRASAEGDTRLMGRRNLLIPHTPLEISLPAGKCSVIFCPLREPSFPAIPSLK